MGKLKHSLFFSREFIYFLNFFKKDFIYLFLERGEGREKERERREGEKYQCVVAFHVPLLGTWPTTQACTLTGI